MACSCSQEEMISISYAGCHASRSFGEAWDTAKRTCMNVRDLAPTRVVRLEEPSVGSRSREAPGFGLHWAVSPGAPGRKIFRLFEAWALLASLTGCSRIRLPASGLFEPAPEESGAELRTVI